jgi:hypothetical protein
MAILDKISQPEKTYPELGKFFGSTNGPGQTMKSSDPNNIPITNKDRIVEKIHNTISDVATGVSTWGTSLRPPNQEEINQGRGGWSERSSILVKSATQGMANELVGGLIGKIAGKLSNPAKVIKDIIKPEVTIEADALKAKMAKFQAKIDASKAAGPNYVTATPNASGIYNKAEVIDHYLGSYPKGLTPGIKEDIMSKSKDEFSQFIKDKTAFQQTGNHWIYSTSKLRDAVDENISSSNALRSFK